MAAFQVDDLKGSRRHHEPIYNLPRWAAGPLLPLFELEIPTVGWDGVDRKSSTFPLLA